MGAVLQAHDMKLGRTVAIKTISDRQNARGVDRERFRSEAQAIARLRHPHIIAIYAIGDHEGCPYFSMEYAERGSLGRFIAEGPMAAIEPPCFSKSWQRPYKQLMLPVSCIAT